MIATKMPRTRVPQSSARLAAKSRGSPIIPQVNQPARPDSVKYLSTPLSSTALRRLQRMSCTSAGQKQSFATTSVSTTITPPVPNVALVRDLLSRIPEIEIPETLADLQWSMKDNIPITKELERLLDLYGPQHITSFSLRHLYQFGAQPSVRNLTSSASFLRHELPIRFAQRVHLFRDLPYEIHSHPLVVVLQKHYATAFLIALQGQEQGLSATSDASLEQFTRRVRYLLYRSSMLSGVAASRAIKIAAQEYLMAVTSDATLFDDADKAESGGEAVDMQSNTGTGTGTGTGGTTTATSGTSTSSIHPPSVPTSFTKHKTSARARALRQRLPNADAWVGDVQLRDVDVWETCQYDEAIWRLYLGDREHAGISVPARIPGAQMNGTGAEGAHGAGTDTAVAAATGPGPGPSTAMDVFAANVASAAAVSEPCIPGAINYTQLQQEQRAFANIDANGDVVGDEGAQAAAGAIAGLGGVVGQPDSYVFPEFFASVIDEYLDLFHVARLETRLLMTQHSALWAQLEALRQKKSGTARAIHTAEDVALPHLPAGDESMSVGMRGDVGQVSPLEAPLNHGSGGTGNHAAGDAVDLSGNGNSVEVGNSNGNGTGGSDGDGEVVVANQEPLGSWWPGRASTLHSRVHPSLPPHMAQVAERNSGRYCHSGAIEHLGKSASAAESKKAGSVGVDGWVGVIEVAMAPLDVCACALAEAVVDAVGKLVKRHIFCDEDIRERLLAWRRARLNETDLPLSTMPLGSGVSPRVRDLQSLPALRAMELAIVREDGTISLSHLQEYLQYMYDLQLADMVNDIGFDQAAMQGRSPFARTPTQPPADTVPVPSQWSTGMSTLLGRAQEETPVDLPPEPIPPAPAAEYTAHAPIVLALPQCLSSALGVQIPEMNVEGEVMYTCRYPRMHLAFVLVELLTNSLENTIISSLSRSLPSTSTPTHPHAATHADAGTGVRAGHDAALHAAVAGDQATVRHVTGASTPPVATPTTSAAATCAPSPPINVLLAQADGIVTLRVEDNAGGVPRDILPYIWSYGRAGPSRVEALAHRRPACPHEHHDHAQHDAHAHQPHAGEPCVSKCESFTCGFGLPLARVVMRYMGGEVDLVSMSGHGTTAYITVRTLRTLS